MRFRIVMLLAYPFIEIFGFIGMIRMAGFTMTCLLFMATTMLGFHLLRMAGVYKRPGGLLIFDQNKNISWMVAGFLLVLPGFFTDMAGLLLLCPFIQRMLQRSLIKVKPNSNSEAGNQQHKGRIIEGEYWHEDK